MVKIQVLQQSAQNPLIFLVVSEGIHFYYELMADTAPEILKAMRIAANGHEVINLDVNDVRSTRRVGVGRS